MGIFNIAMWGSMGLVAVVMIALISPALLVIDLIMCTLPIIVPKAMSKHLSKTRREYSKEMAGYTGKTSELLKGFESLMTSNGIGYFLHSHNNASEELYGKDLRMRKTVNIASIFTSLAAWIPSIMVLIVGVFLVSDGKITRLSCDSQLAYNLYYWPVQSSVHSLRQY